MVASAAEFMSQFVDSAANNYRLRDTSRYRWAATDGSALGADIEGISRRTPPQREPRTPTYSK
jgi:hypothetical protein